MKIFMQKIFWPLLTVVFTIIVLVLWFSNSNKETVVNNDSSVLIGQQINLPPETSYEIKGQEVILRGRVASEEKQQQLIASIQSIPGVKDVVSELIILPDVDILSFCMNIDDSAVTLTGALPIDVKNDSVMAQVEQKKPGFLVYDQLTLVGNTSPEFGKQINDIIALLPSIDKGKVALWGNDIFVDQDNLVQIKERASLPNNYNIKVLSNDWDNEKCQSLTNTKNN